MKTYYREIDQETEVFRRCYENQMPLLIKGPTGCGKSQFISYMAEQLNRPLIKVACNEDTSSADLLGRFLIKGSETVWQDGPVARAVREGALLYLDEIAEAREDVIVALHPLTDHRRELYLDRTNETLQAPDSFMCIASFNPGYQKGFKELKPSNRQRFVTMSLGYPPAELESEIIANVTGLETKMCTKLVQLAQKIRSQSQLDLRETVSTRLLVHAARLTKAGFPLRKACHFAIAECLSDDSQVVEGLQDLINLNF